jgi:uncharacterized protein
MERKSLSILATLRREQAQRQVIVNVSDEDIDRAGDVVEQRGIDFSAFMAIGGTVLWQHDVQQPVAKCIEMGIVDGKLRAKVQFPDAGVSKKADEVYGLVKAGIINAASIGFSPRESESIDARESYGGARRFKKVELIEFSFVSVPCARGATIVARSVAPKKPKREVMTMHGRVDMIAIAAAIGTGLKRRMRELGMGDNAWRRVGFVKTAIGFVHKDDADAVRGLLVDVESMMGQMAAYRRHHGLASPVAEREIRLASSSRACPRICANGRSSVGSPPCFGRTGPRCAPAIPAACAAWSVSH